MRMGHCCVAGGQWDCCRKAITSLITVTKLRRKLGQCCAKLHFGTVLGALSLLLLAVHARETGSVLCQTALWDCLRNAIVSFQV